MDIFGIIYKAIDGLKKSIDGLLKNMDKALKKQDALFLIDGTNVKNYRDLLFGVINDLPLEYTSNTLFVSKLNKEMWFTNESGIIAGYTANGYILKFDDKVRALSHLQEDRQAIMGILYIDLANSESMGSYLFEGCSNMQYIKKINNSQNLTSLYSCFEGCKLLKKIPDMPDAKILDMGSAFEDCSSLIEVPEFSTKNVSYFSRALYGCSSLEHFPDWDFSSASNLEEMASETPNLKEDISLHISSDIRSMRYTFTNSGITGIDLIMPRNDSNEARNFDSTFENAKNLKYVNISDNGEGSYGIFIAYSPRMFYDCEELETVTFNTEFLTTSAVEMFYNCKKLTSVIGLGNLHSCEKTFYNCISLETLPSFGTIMFSSNYGTYTLFSDDNNGADSALTTIEKLHIDNRYSKITFIINASKLTDFGGIEKMGFKDLVIDKSPLLTRESCNNIFKDALTITHTGSIHLHKDAYDRLTPEDIAVATNKGWSVISANEY